jgi:hypothetical protein
MRRGLLPSATHDRELPMQSPVPVLWHLHLPVCLIHRGWANCGNPVVTWYLTFACFPCLITERVADEMRAGVSYDTDPKELSTKQVGS